MREVAGGLSIFVNFGLAAGPVSRMQIIRVGNMVDWLRGSRNLP